MENIEQTPFQPTNKTNISGWIVGSILLHLLVIWLFDQQVNIPSSDSEPAEQTIKATLVFAPPVIEIVTEVTQEPEIVEVETPEPVEIQEPTEQAIHDVITEEPQVTQEVTDIVTQEQLSDVLPEAQSDASSPRNHLPPISSKDMLKRHMQSLSSVKDQEMAADASREFQYNRVSPKFPAANIDPFETPEEKLMRESVVNVDCSSTTNKVVVALAGIVAGNMKCTKPPPFQQFIDKRLNKESETSGR